MPCARAALFYSVRVLLRPLNGTTAPATRLAFECPGSHTGRIGVQQPKWSGDMFYVGYGMVLEVGKRAHWPKTSRFKSDALRQYARVA